MRGVRRSRGFAVSVEAVIASAILAFLILLAFAYITSGFLPKRAVSSQTVVEAKLCGTVLTVMNVGSAPALSIKVHGETGGSLVDATSSLPKTSLQPGESMMAVLRQVYVRVVVSGENFDSVVARNECAS